LELTSPVSKLTLKTSARPQTPPPRRFAPPRTPDSSGLTPSSHRALARRRTHSPQLSPTPIFRDQPITPISATNVRPRRTIRRRHFYGDTPTPPPPVGEGKLCHRNRHMKPLADYIDINTGEEYDVCKDCRADVEYIRQRAAEIEAEIQRGEEDLQRFMGNFGTKIFCNV